MLAPALLFVTALAPHSAVYVKGHSRAAIQTRRRLSALTCYDPVATREASAAVLEVDHILKEPGNRSVVMILTKPHGELLWEGKAREDPLPFVSPVKRLLKRLAKSTCREPTLSSSNWSVSARASSR
jgi:hypothetical protein